MLDRQSVIDCALQYPGAVADCPFEADDHTTVLRHGPGGKWFGILLTAPRKNVGLEGDGGAEVINLKCDPLLAYGLTHEYPDIVPGYHMNHRHWISVRLEGDLPEDVLEMLIGMSYDLTMKKRRGK